MQSKLESFIESNANTFIGFIGSMLIWEFVIKPLWHLQTSFTDNFTITMLFTVWSIARGYGTRRYFNWRRYGRGVPKLVAKSADGMPVLVGITGRAGVGKDTLAGFLGYPTDHFAATLKAMLAAAGLPEPATREAKEAIIPGLGFSWRQAAQTLGTEWGRALNPDLWVLLLARRCGASGRPVVTITDVRFENEAALIRKHGILCHVDGRETTVQGATADHASEAGVRREGGDYCIINAGTLPDLKLMAGNFRQAYVEAYRADKEAG
jgi:hypothetical protein